jgi:hypothetical protein
MQSLLKTVVLVVLTAQKRSMKTPSNYALVTIIDHDNSFIFMLKKYFKIIAKSG